MSNETSRKMSAIKAMRRVFVDAGLPAPGLKDTKDIVDSIWDRMEKASESRATDGIDGPAHWGMRTGETVAVTLHPDGVFTVLTDGGTLTSSRGIDLHKI